MRLATLNTLSGLATLAILVVLALPARSVFQGASAQTRPAAALPRVEPARHPSRVRLRKVRVWNRRAEADQAGVHAAMLRRHARKC